MEFAPIFGFGHDALETVSKLPAHPGRRNNIRSNWTYFLVLQENP